MTTQEIIGPLILYGIFSMLGSFAIVGASAIKKLTVNNADESTSEFQRTPSEESRKRFLLLFLLAPFIFGGIWGLVHLGIFANSINEPISYAIAMGVGVVSNSIVLQLNNMNIEALIKIIKDIFKQ